MTHFSPQAPTSDISYDLIDIDNRNVNLYSYVIWFIFVVKLIFEMLTVRG